MLVICNGMIRAGSTLQYNMARSLVDALGVGQEKGFFEAANLRSSEIDRWTRGSDIFVIKMHDLHPAVFGTSAIDATRFLCIYRDLRAVVASIRNKWDPEWRSLLVELDKAVEVYFSLKDRPSILSQRYEDVMTDQAGALRAVADAMGLTLSRTTSWISLPSLARWTQR